MSELNDPEGNWEVPFGHVDNRFGQFIAQSGNYTNYREDIDVLIRNNQIDTTNLEILLDIFLLIGELSIDISVQLKKFNFARNDEIKKHINIITVIRRKYQQNINTMASNLSSKESDKKTRSRNINLEKHESNIKTVKSSYDAIMKILSKTNL